MKRISLSLSLPRWLLDFTSQKDVQEVRINWNPEEVPAIRKEVEVFKNDPEFKLRQVTFYVIDGEGNREEIESEKEIGKGGSFLARTVSIWAKEQGKDQYEITIWDLENK